MPKLASWNMESKVSTQPALISNILAFLSQQNVELILLQEVTLASWQNLSATARNLGYVLDHNVGQVGNNTKVTLTKNRQRWDNGQNHIQGLARAVINQTRLGFGVSGTSKITVFDSHNKSGGGHNTQVDVRLTLANAHHYLSQFGQQGMIIGDQNIDFPLQENQNIKVIPEHKTQCSHTSIEWTAIHPEVPYTHKSCGSERVLDFAWITKGVREHCIAEAHINRQIHDIWNIHNFWALIDHQPIVYLLREKIQTQNGLNFIQGMTSPGSFNWT
jgi:exonuclease III